MEAAWEFFKLLMVIAIAAMVFWVIGSLIYKEFRQLMRDEAAKDKRVSKTKK